MWEHIKELLNETLITIGKTQLKVSSIITLIVFWVCVAFVMKIIKKSIYRIHSFDEAKKYSIFTLIKYILLVVVLVLSLEIVGFNLSVLLAGSAALLVGLGLGIQNLFSDYISGIVILVDSTVKMGDVIEVNNIVGTVQEIRLRTTTVLTRDDKYIIIPNSDLTKNELINWTHNDLASRFDVTVGVDYSSDVDLVTRILHDAAAEEQGILTKPEPFVRFNNFGDSSLDFSIYFWVEDVFRAENVKSRLRYKILDKFRQNGVSIPFPQRVIHKAAD
ncbi:mechanosensitive ion channel protein MscS [Flavobacterium beibuense F44-8]|uniref:Mechanosensitive ion channel protein MscS n=1 Tax=Flavobacterium beibuense F44-8 TaxID=1406840 RepID=A0A0A2LRJ5_9FLAO|nr:mechanosensitive ion channel domain-containing protein [Flavobacterium beibuense]KGO82569.1 mechanosensitive ion channel protein MscS [Flavobacterium beibuense F44-8]